MKSILFTLVALFFAPHIWAKNPNVAIYFNQYQNAKGQPYIETYFSLDPSSVLYTQNPDGTWQGGIEILLTIEDDEKIIAYDKLQLLSVPTADTNQFVAHTVQQSRMMLEAGEYTMKIELADIENPSKPETLQRQIQVKANRNELTTSNILILDSFKKSSQKSVASKWGYDLIPIVPMGSYVLRDEVKSLPFYCEIYNTDTALGVNAPLLIKYSIINQLNNKKVSGYSGFMRANAAPVIPALNQFNIAQLPSGYYAVAIEIVDRENKLIGSQKTPFYRTNMSVDFSSYDLASNHIDRSFVDDITSFDSLVFNIDCLYPISDYSERRMQENLLKSGDTVLMKRFLLSFWVNKNPINYEDERLDYLNRVAYIQEKYGSSSKPGYRTDMGRVYLQYGKPTLKEVRPRTGDMYPYEIWQYDELKSASTQPQANQNFVFVDQMLTGRDYTLIHSSARNEIQDYKWQYQLNRNTNRGSDVDATSGQAARDPFGSRIENNFIIGDRNYWQGDK